MFDVLRYALVASALWAIAPHGGKIHVELRPALETLQKLAAAQESFDLVFIDSNKTEYV